MLLKRSYQAFKHVALAALAAVAPMSAAAAMASLIASPTPQASAPAEMSPQEVKVERDDVRVGPGVHRMYQRNLTGLEIRAVRMAKRNCGTNRTGRSKYIPDGIPARVVKFQRFANNSVIQAAGL